MVGVETRVEVDDAGQVADDIILMGLGGLVVDWKGKSTAVSRRGRRHLILRR